MKKIPLSKGKLAIVDDEDYVYLNRFSWSADKSEDGNYYVSTAVWGGERQMRLQMISLLIKSKRGYKAFHLNKNTLDFRKENLKILPAAYIQNRSKKFKRECSSIYKGVRYKDGKWEVAISKDGKHFYIGRFSGEKLAAVAYNKKSKELYGEFAYQNNI